MKKINFKKILPHIAAIIFFLAITVAYFSPVVFDNKDLPQGDITNGLGWGNDLREYHNQTGEYAFWSNRMFGGMPANYTFMPPTANVFRVFSMPLRLYIKGYTIALVFLYLIGFYIFLISLRCKPLLAVVGAVAYAFVSYNFIIISAGHANKALVMSSMAPILGGIILCFRGKYLWGAIVTLIFAGLNVLWGHQQISYYLLLTVLPLVVVYFIYAVKEKTLPQFFKSLVLLIGIAVLSVLPALGYLIPTADYTGETMRGGTVLQQNAKGEKENSGLDINYAYAWSYGVGETMTLLIPNFNGASSHYNIGDKSETYAALRQTGQAAQFCKQAPMYWGEKPFTSGPVYAGAIICFLFVLGLYVVKGPEKWWLLAATIISIVLSWGKNFTAVNEFLFYHLPLYNKFRVPEMALVIANVTMATLGILALKTIFDEKNSKEKYLKPLYFSAGITGGLCLLFALVGGSMFNFSSATDAGFPDWLNSALRADRKNMLTGDAWRSLIFIVLAAGLLYFYLKKNFKTTYCLAAVGALILIDLWGVDKRFINDDSFVPKRQARAIAPTEADKQILQDKDPDYRVLNLTTSTFNESLTSYFHNSIGGYSPVKLRRYQDIIDFYLSGNINMNVLNMLNTRYVIVSTEDGGQQVQRNPEAIGNAWFVDSIMWAQNPDEEIVALKNTNPATTAIIDKVWQEKIPNYSALQHATDSAAFIKLSSYVNPGNLIYESSSTQPQLAVFSEIFYKTWHAYIDGNETPIIRANYILRAVEIPAGTHKIEFKCIDDVFNSSSKIALYSSIFVGIVLLSLFGLAIWKGIKKSKAENIDCE